jgi:hypothetical protein
VAVKLHALVELPTQLQKTVETNMSTYREVVIPGSKPWSPKTREDLRLRYMSHETKPTPQASNSNLFANMVNDAMDFDTPEKTKNLVRLDNRNKKKKNTLDNMIRILDSWCTQLDSVMYDPATFEDKRAELEYNERVLTLHQQLEPLSGEIISIDPIASTTALMNNLKGEAATKDSDNMAQLQASLSKVYAQASHARIKWASAQSQIYDHNCKIATIDDQNFVSEEYARAKKTLRIKTLCGQPEDEEICREIKDRWRRGAIPLQEAQEQLEKVEYAKNVYYGVKKLSASGYTQYILDPIYFQLHKDKENYQRLFYDNIVLARRLCQRIETLRL